MKNLDVNQYLDRKEARKMDRYTQLALIAAKQAVEDSSMDLETEDKNRIGVVFGSQHWQQEADILANKKLQENLFDAVWIINHQAITVIKK